MYLAAAGVGHLTIADGDRVDETNLHRQVLFSEGDVGAPKAEAAAGRLRAMNAGVRVDAVAGQVDAANARALVGAADLVVDGSDNFATRYLLSDACVLAGRPLVHGSVSRFDGQATLLVAGGAPCYRCLFPVPPAQGTVPSCAEAGVLGVLPGLVGVTQAAIVLQQLLGYGESLAGRLLLLEGRALRWTEVAVARDPSCPACGDARTLATIGDLPGGEAGCDPAPGAGPGAAPGAAPGAEAAEEIAPRDAATRRASGWSPVLLDVREPWEWQLARLDDATLVPMSEIPSRRGELDPGAEYLVYCHHGVRSAAVAAWLRGQGYGRVTNLAGGIDRWSREVDPAVPRY
jgi:adenylyltransferase/sulfurtransferase